MPPNGSYNEALFNETLASIIAHLQHLGNIETVIGIPFYNEQETLIELITTLDQNRQCLPSPNTLLVCAGDPAGYESLEHISNMKLSIPHTEFVLKPGANGRGASIRILMEIADFLEADLIILAADLKQEKNRGFKPDWVRKIAQPIKSQYDLVVGRFQRHGWEDLPGRLFTSPLIEVLYGRFISDPHCGLYGISHDLVEDYCQEMRFWTPVISGYGIDPWLITRALKWNKRICEVQLGAKLASLSKEKLNYVFKQTALSLFECINRDNRFWISRVPIYKQPETWGLTFSTETPKEPHLSFYDLVTTFKRNCNQYQRLIDALLPPSLAEAVRDETLFAASAFSFDHGLWAKVVYHFIVGYAFQSRLPQDDILSSLTFIFDGRIADFIARTAKPEGLDYESVNDPRWLTWNATVEAAKERQRQAFFDFKEEFFEMWQKTAEECRPPLTPAHYMEFIPGVPIMLAKELRGVDGTTVYADEIFNRLHNRYQERFDNFVHQGLGLPVTSEPQALVRGVEGFIEELEGLMESLFPGDLYTEEGTKEVLGKVFSLCPLPLMFSIKDEMLKELLLRLPPQNLLISLGCKTAHELLDKTEVRDAVTMALLNESQVYLERALHWLLDNLQPDCLAYVELKPLVLGKAGPFKLLATSTLNKLTTRLVVSPLSKGMGGRFPKLRFVLTVLRQMAIAQNYSQMWETFHRERKNVAQKIGNSLLGWNKAGVFSANNILETSHHHRLIDMVRILSLSLEESGKQYEKRILNLMTESYGLSQVLEDGTFLPCSAWTWASYSYKGGRGTPTPISSHVEEGWFNREFLDELFASLGYDPKEIDSQVVQLIGEGRANDDLLEVALEAVPEGVVAVPQEVAEVPPAGQLQRYPGNPILSPIKEHYWESKYVLNAAAFRIKDKVYIIYRAFGGDEISRLGLAVSDGFRILERLPYPIFEPEGPKEKKGCEDPRVVLIEDEIYMVYTAYDGVIAQVAAASITIEDFLARRFDRWQRKGLAFEDVWDKDALLFPERIGGKYVIYHRIEPSIWVSYLDRLEFPVPKERHAIIMGPRSGRMWDSVKIGAGTQPIMTKFGWLMIYHGVDRQRVYRLGVILVDADNPERLLYRSPNPILEPKEPYEIGIPGQSWVPNVVFTCGAVPVKEKKVLDADDEIIVYYGAADTHVCAATATVGQLIPEGIRRRYEK